MGIFIVLLLTALIIVLIFRTLKKGNLPENNYIPFDDIIDGKKEESNKRDSK